MLASVTRSHSACCCSASSALARDEDALGVLQGDRAEPLLLVVLLRHHSPPSLSAASRVPSTRARIFSNAVSRVVVVSSQKGENPQSSHRAQLPDRDVLGRLEDPVPDFLRRLDPRVDRVDDADEDPLARLHVMRG